jgi:heme-degrading monooxygenase HmoA
MKGDSRSRRARNSGSRAGVFRNTAATEDFIPAAIRAHAECTMPQIRTDNRLVTQVTVVEPGAGKQAEALALMKDRARFMAGQPGFVSIVLHRSVDGKRIVNYVQWQSRELLESAHRSPEFRKEWGQFDRLAEGIDAHLYEVTHVEEGSRQA